MKTIASRSTFKLAVGLLGYAAVFPMLLLLAGGYGGILGFTIGNAFGVDAERVGGLFGYGFLFTLGPLLIFSLAREAWARIFRQVRLGKEHLEFERFGTTISWRLDELRCLRVASQSTNVNGVGATEVSVCLTGPDQRKLHLTDLNASAFDELTDVISHEMTVGMERRLEQGPIKFGPTLASHLNIYSLGPPLLCIPMLGAINLAWLGVLLAVLYFGHLFRQMRQTSVNVTTTGLRGADGQEIPWSKVKSSQVDFDRVRIDTTEGIWTINGPENMFPLGTLINHMVSEARETSPNGREQ